MTPLSRGSAVVCRYGTSIWTFSTSEETVSSAIRSISTSSRDSPTVIFGVERPVHIQFRIWTLYSDPGDKVLVEKSNFFRSYLFREAPHEPQVP